MDNKIFYWALLISLFIHVCVLANFSRNKKKLLKKNQKIEVTYQEMQIEPKQKQEIYQDINLVEEKQEPSAQELEILESDMQLFEPVGKTIRDISKLTDSFEIDKKMTMPQTPMSMDRQISVPVFQSEKITNPKYLSYNQNIREKIRRRAYAYVDHPDFKTGEVYLTFIVASDGHLVQTSILEARTNANAYLKRIGERAIVEAAPFPAFPEDLDYPELTFNVVISFELK